MGKPAAILQPHTNRAHYVAQGVLCALASACVAAAFCGFAVKTPRVTVPANQVSIPALTPTPALQPAPATTFILPPSPSVAASIPIPAIPSPTPTAASRPVPSVPANVQPPRPALPLDKQLKNPQVIEAVMAARELRRQGDMQAALESLKSADVREPDHPEVLGEMALTYEEMGIATRAEAIWRQIFTMGEATAGGYFALARSKMDRPSAATTEAAAPAASPVSLGVPSVTRESTTPQSEHITVRLPILAKPGATIDPTQIVIHGFLFESVNNGGRVEQVPLEKTKQNWATLPLNWSEPGGELVDVTYDLQTQKPGEAGARTFHGYIVKLYYQNKLAGEQTQPESLRDAAQKRATPAGLDNALFPK